MTQEAMSNTTPDQALAEKLASERILEALAKVQRAQNLLSDAAAALSPIMGMRAKWSASSVTSARTIGLPSTACGTRRSSGSTIWSSTCTRRESTARPHRNVLKGGPHVLRQLQ